MLRRDYKLSGPGEFYHIYNRGNEKRNIFREQTDYEFFIWRLAHNLFPERFPNKHRTPPLPTKAFSLISYCLMPNHFHLLLKQEKEISPSKLLLRLCTSYSMYFNKKYKRVGHLFQDQFKQILIDNNEYLLWLSAYIHDNPRAAGLTNKLSDYRWSSLPEFINQKPRPSLCDTRVILSQFKNSKDHLNFITNYYDATKENGHVLESLLIDSHDDLP